MRTDNKQQNIICGRQRCTDGVFKVSVTESLQQERKHLGGLVVAASMTIAIMAVNLGNVGYTGSYFADTETSADNSFIASLLDFVISPGDLIETYIGPEDNGSTIFITTVSPEEGSDLKYRVFAEELSGNPAFCSALRLQATSSPFIYDGPLLALSVEATTTIGVWTKVLSMTNVAGISHGDSCNIDLVYKGWKVGMTEGAGYTDEERVHLKLYAQMIVINEFLPNPIGDDHAPMPGGEWVELYNIGDAPIDVAGWVIYDSLDSHPLVISTVNSNNNNNTADGGETIIPAGGYLVVYLNGVYTGWLNNTGGDSVRLYDGEIGSAVIIDTYSYVGSALENKSYARIPDGLGAWIDPVPTPGFENTIEQEIYSVSVPSQDPVSRDSANTTIVIEVPKVEMETASSTGSDLVEVVADVTSEPVLPLEETASTSDEVVQTEKENAIEAEVIEVAPEGMMGEVLPEVEVSPENVPVIEPESLPEILPAEEPVPIPAPEPEPVVPSESEPVTLDTPLVVE